MTVRDRYDRPTDRSSIRKSAPGPVISTPAHGLISRFLPTRLLPSAAVPLLPGFPLRLPLGPLAGASRSETLGRIGALEVRLARTVGEVKRAQAIRYQIFYEEMSAIADARTLMTRRDADEFDAISDHLVVIDHASDPGRSLGRKRPAIVGTYRLLRQETAGRHDGFYSAGEFDVDPLLRRHPSLRFLELGRSCVLPQYRGKRTVELLWQGIWSYALRHRIDVMIGCASLEGTDPKRHAMPLSFLHHHAQSPAEWMVHARPERHIDMGQFDTGALDPRQALNGLPPLIKGYLRLGATIGDGAVVDHQFGTTDVFLVLPVGRISQRYIDFYRPDASRHGPADKCVRMEPA